MTSKGKEFYKTFKRSVSDKLGQSSSSATSSSGAKYGGGSGKTWIHPPDVLLNGRVEYSVKFFGQKDVDKAKGTDTIRDAITAIRFQLQVKRGETGHSGAKLQKVDLQINIEGVTIVDSKTKMIIHRYPLQRISFCADDKQDKRLFSFIAKSETPNENGSDRHDCLVFLSDKMAEQITLTVGEAFDLAFKRYMDKNLASLENTKQVLFLRKRIAELEAENQVLSQRLAEVLRAPKQSSSGHAPALPTTPIPRGPPSGVNPQMTTAEVYATPIHQIPPHPLDDLITQPSKFGPSVNTNITSPLGVNGTARNSNSSSSTSPSGPAPSHPPPPVPAPSLAPPPPVVPRRHPPKPDAATKTFEGTNVDKAKDVFDDNFDPRAEEKQEKKAEDYDPFGDDFLDDVMRIGHEASKKTLERSDNPTADDFQAMIDQVDKRLAEMRSGFGSGNLETGEVSPGESFKGLDESDYGTPSDRVNPAIVSKKSV